MSCKPAAGHKFQPIRGLSHDRATVGAGTIHTDLLFRLSGTTRASAAGTVWSCACQTVLTLQRNPAAAHMSAQQMLHDTIAIVGYGGVCRWCTCSLKLPNCMVHQQLSTLQLSQHSLGWNSPFLVRREVIRVLGTHQLQHRKHGHCVN